MKIPKRNDDLGDSFPNDPLEVVIILVALICMGAGGVFLYFLGSQP